MNQKLWVVLTAVLFMLSCAGGTRNSATSPPLVTDSVNSANQADSPGTHQLWGFWRITIDPASMTADIEPLRGVEFTCNVTQFMQPPSSPINMISLAILPGSDPSNGYFKVDVTLKHPFPGMNLYRGFDVRGVLIANGSISSTHDPSATYAGTQDVQLLNADGLTRWWNPSEFTTFNTIFGFTSGKLAPPVKPSGTVNGFKYFADALGHDQGLWELDPASRGSFPTTPGIYTRPYFIQFPLVGGKPDYTFNYAVDASWAQPDPAGIPNYDIQYFPPSANMAEPYCISVVDNGSSAYYKDSSDNGGSLKLAIRVYDWQSPTNPSGVTGEISGLWLESPVLSTPVDVLPIATIAPDGPTSSVFQVELSSLNLTKSGDESLFVFAQASDIFGYEPQVVGGDKFHFPSAPLGSYCQSTVNIKTGGSGPPIVTGIVPNSAKSSEVLTGVQVNGLNFQTGAQVELRCVAWPAIVATNEATQTGGTQIICDFDLYAAAEGAWDIVVTNPDLQQGTLSLGFHIDCGTVVHSYEGKHSLTGDSWNYCQRGDLTILEAGPYAGQCVVKSHFDYTSPPYTGYYVRFNPDNAADAAVTPFFSARGTDGGSTNYVSMTGSIDQNPVNGQIAVQNGRVFDKLQIFDQSGAYLEDVIVYDPSTPASQVPVIEGVDFDNNGDLWLIANIMGGVDESWPTVWQFRHYEVQTSSPYYTEKLADRLDITSDLYDPTGGGQMTYLADIAISYTEHSLIVFAGTFGPHSYFVKYDLNTSPPTMVLNKDLIPSFVICQNPFGLSRADIEFDHSDLSAENCRLMVMYQTWDGAVQAHMMRLDTGMDILNDEIVASGLGAWDNPHAIAINTNPTKRNIVAIDMDYNPPFNDFWYFPMPTGW